MKDDHPKVADMRLSKPSQLFLGGVVVALLVCGAGQLIVHGTESKLIGRRIGSIQIAPNTAARVGEAEAECVKSGGIYDAIASHYSVNEIKLAPVCKVWVQLMDRTGSWTDQPAASADRSGTWLQFAERWTLPAAAVVLALSALPWLWYFILRRIRELHDAIVGK